MDLSRAPLGERQRKAIVEAIRQDGDVREKHFLEAKRSFDLNSKEDCVKVAKFILGAANRTVDLAARAFKGYAVMVLGAEKGRVGGVASGMEILNLEQKISGYLGSSGPKWDLERHPADEDEAEVLFVVVEPPQQGDPVFVCRKSFDGSNSSSSLRDGDVYVRTQGQTRKADSADLDRLFKRASQQSATMPEFAVSLDSPAHLILPSDDVRKRILVNSIEEARQKYVKVESNAFPSLDLTDLAGSHPMFGPTKWTTETFNSRAEEWEGELTRTWPDILDKLAGAVLSGQRFSVRNLQEQFLEAVRIEIFFENVRGVECAAVEDLDMNDLIPPLIHTSDPYGWGAPPYDFAGLRAAAITTPLQWHNRQDGLLVVIELKHLRPSTTWSSDDDELVLLTTSTTVTARWCITARGFDQAFSGTFPVSVSSPLDFVGLTHLMQPQS